MKKIVLVTFLLNFSLITATILFATNQVNEGTTVKQEQSQSGEVKGEIAKFGKYLAAGLAILGATLSSGLGVGRIGSAAMGAISEKPELLGASLIFVALAEGICLWGIAGAFLILFF